MEVTKLHFSTQRDEVARTLPTGHGVMTHNSSAFDCTRQWLHQSPCTVTIPLLEESEKYLDLKILLIEITYPSHLLGAL